MSTKRKALRYGLKKQELGAVAHLFALRGMERQGAEIFGLTRIHAQPHDVWLPLGDHYTERVGEEYLGVGASGGRGEGG